MSFSESGGIITQTGTDLNLQGLTGSVTTSSFILQGGGIPEAVTIKGVETLSNPITLSGNGSGNINNLISAWNSGNPGTQIVRMSSTSSGQQVLASGQTITIPAGITGVTTKTEYGNIVIYEVENTLRFKIEGTLYHNPENEILIIKHDWNLSNASNPTEPALWVDYNTNAWKNVTAVSKNSDNRLVLTVTSHGYSVGDAVEYQVTEAGAERLSNVVFPILETTNNTITLGMTEYEPYTPANSGATNRVTRRAVYHYGNETSGFGNTRTSTACGLFITGTPESFFQERGAGLRVGADGLFKSRGGVIFSTRPTALGNIDIDGTELVTPPSLTISDTRSLSGGVIKDLKLVRNQFSGLQQERLLFASFILTEGSVVETLSQSYYEVVLRDFDSSSNVGESDISHSSDDRFRHRDWVVINSKSGSSVRGMFRTSTGNLGQTQKGVTVVKKEVSFNIKDSLGSAIQGVKMYLEDTPSAYAKNATFPVPTGSTSNGNVTHHRYRTYAEYVRTSGNRSLFISGINDQAAYSTVTFEEDNGIGSNVVVSFSSGNLLIKFKTGATHAEARDAINTNLSSDFASRLSGAASQALAAITATSFDPGESQFTDARVPLTEGVLNADGTVTYDYTSVLTYSKTSDAAGDISTTAVTIGVQILEFLSDDPTASSQNGNGGPYNITLSGNNWVDGNGDRPTNEAWDTTEFGGFYKVDRRGNGNTDEDLFSFNFCAYDKLLLTSNNSLKGIGELVVDIVLVQDLLITQTNKTTVDAYTIIENSEKFYDRAKAYLTDNFAGETSTIVSRDGDTIDAGSYNVTIDNSAGQAFGLSGNTITIKSSSFTGNITTSGTVTLVGSINYVGTITDVSGTRSFGSYQIKNLVNGSRVQVYNTTTGAEIYNAVVNATSLTEGFINTGPKAMNTNDNMRVRVAYQNGATAKEPQELLATCQYPTWEVSANQVDATQYNNYSVDGSTIAEFSLDIGAGKIEVDINDADNSTTVQRVASWYYAELMEAAGISDLFGAIDWIEDNQIAIDQSKVDLLLDNIKGVPLILKGGRLYRLDGTTIIASSSNSIQIDYAPVYIANAPLIEKIDKNTKLIPALL